MDFLDLYNYSIILLIIPLMALSFVAIKYTRSGRSRLVAAVLFLIATVYTFVIPLEFTSWPKSVTTEWYSRNTETATVLWAGVHPDTKKIYILLYWEGQDRPRYYRLDNFEDEEQEMRMGEELQEAMEESQKAKEQGGTGSITMKYPFLSPEERAERMAADAAAMGSGTLEMNLGGVYRPGYENDDSTFSVEPPPPPLPEKE